MSTHPMERALALLEAGSARAARGALRRILSDEPRNVEARRALARAWDMEGNHGRCARVLRELLEEPGLAPLTAANVCRDLARYYTVWLDRPKKAIEYYRRAVDLAPSWEGAPWYILASCWYLLARTRRRGRRASLAEALRTLEEGARAGLSPAHGLYLDAAAASIRGDREGAAARLEEALREGLQHRARIATQMALGILKLHRAGGGCRPLFRDALREMRRFYAPMNFFWRYLALLSLKLFEEVSAERAREVMFSEPADFAGKKPEYTAGDVDLFLDLLKNIDNSCAEGALESLRAVDAFFQVEEATVEDILYLDLALPHFHALAHLHLGDIRRRRGERNEALREYAQALTHFPGSLPARERIAQLARSSRARRT